MKPASWPGSISAWWAWRSIRSTATSTATCGKCGADYVTVFQETYDAVKYETLHLMGHKRVWPYRFEAQERALMGGMRGVGFSALLGLPTSAKDALPPPCMSTTCSGSIPTQNVPVLPPAASHHQQRQDQPLDVHERQLCQVLCAYRIFLPFAGITVSSRERAQFPQRYRKIAATKSPPVSPPASVIMRASTPGREGDGEAQGDEQFEICDGRSFDTMYEDLSEEGLQPVLNDYLYV